MTLHQRRELILSRRTQLLKPEWRWHGLLYWNRLLLNLLRLGFFLLVLAVLAGVWVVGDAHLTEQFLGAPKTARGLINQDTRQGALTPDNIEKQVLTLALRLRERELDIPAGSNPRPRPFYHQPRRASALYRSTITIIWVYHRCGSLQSLPARLG